MSPEAGVAPRFGQASPYYCSTRSAVPGGVHEGRIPLSFPPEALSGDGSVMEYRYRRQTPSGVVSYTADCVIPRTMPALELMNRRFRVPPDQGSPKGRDEKGGEFTTLGCVTDSTNGCTLEPITVVGTSPQPDPEEEPHPSYTDPLEPTPLPFPLSPTDPEAGEDPSPDDGDGGWYRGLPDLYAARFYARPEVRDGAAKD